MKHRNNHGHPDLETLLAFAEGDLEAKELQDIENHLEGCAECRLEIKRYQRFQDMGLDPDELAESNWAAAELKLARAYKEQILPAIDPAIDPAPGTSPDPAPVPAETPASARNPRRLFWMVPAVAAVLALMYFIQPEGLSDGPVGFEPRGALRGGDQIAEPLIHLVGPIGEISAIPDTFSWTSDLEMDHFTVEIFTTDLERIHFQDEITCPFWVPEDAGEFLLEPGVTYLWSALGYAEGQMAGESGTVWFKVVP